MVTNSDFLIKYLQTPTWLEERLAQKRPRVAERLPMMLTFLMPSLEIMAEARGAVKAESATWVEPIRATVLLVSRVSSIRGSIRHPNPYSAPLRMKRANMAAATTLQSLASCACVSSFSVFSDSLPS